MEVTEEEIDLGEIFQIVIKRWKLILIPGIILAVLVTIFSYLSPRSYESYSLIKIGNIGSNSIESISTIKDIMESLPERQQIAQNLNEADNKKFIKSLSESIEYLDQSGLLKIRTVNTDPVKASNMIKVVSDIILKRHEVLYLDGQKELDKVLNYVKKTINPVPLSAGIPEFKITRTEIVVPAFTDFEPLPAKRKVFVGSVFFITMFICLIAAFIMERRKI